MDWRNHGAAMVDKIYSYLKSAWLSTRREELCIPLLNDDTRLDLLSRFGDALHQNEQRELGDICKEGLRELDTTAQILITQLRIVRESLHFWQAKSQGSSIIKLRVMILERGPKAFLHTVVRSVRIFVTKDISDPSIVDRASARIVERVKMLQILHNLLATALGKVYSGADKLAAGLATGQWQEALRDVLVAAHAALQELEGSYSYPERDYLEGDERNLRNVILSLDAIQANEVPTASDGKLVGKAGEAKPKVMKNISKQIQEAAMQIKEDGSRVESSLSILMLHYRKPPQAARYWVQYTGAGVGLAVVTGWIISHSQLAGSSDLQRWIDQGKESALVFLREHAIIPLLSIRDELFSTFSRRPHSKPDVDEVELTADSLRRMLLAFTANVGKDPPDPDASNQQLMELVMEKYELELLHPIVNLLKGELARAMLIQVQKLKLDIETAMLELDQILRANEINFAVLAALPALLLAIGLGSLTRQFFVYKLKGREGRGRAAQMQRRQLAVDVERCVLAASYLTKADQDEEQERHLGLLIYSLHKLYQSVHWHAEELGEWDSLRMDILELSRRDLPPEFKVAVATRLERVYESLVPVPRL